MFRHLTVLVTFTVAIYWSCTSSRNAAASGFDFKGSDAKAVQIADEVMNAMGGRQAWDATRYLCWTFFGRRQHYWDKFTGNVRIESFQDSTLYVLNVNTLKGRVERQGIPESDPDTLAKLLRKAKSLWINDSYWLVMPFKLKDTGVTLRYLGEGKTENGRAADILQLTFKAVGDTPDNKYHVFVDKESRLVTEWAFFKNFADEKPEFVSPWEGYQRYGNILLSGGRGFRSITGISTPATLPAELFSIDTPKNRNQ